jgi:hypothetical protein
MLTALVSTRTFFQHAKLKCSQIEDILCIFKDALDAFFNAYEFSKLLFKSSQMLGIPSAKCILRD